MGLPTEPRPCSLCGVVRQLPSIPAIQTRFAIGSPTGLRSAVWRAWPHTNRAKADVFLAPRSLVKILKLSFHESGEIRDAFTSRFALQTHDPLTPGGGRARLVWKRTDYTSTGVARLYQVCFPHSELRQWPLDPDLNPADVSWIPLREDRDATFVELVLTRPGIEELELLNFEAATTGPVAHWYLPTRENFLILPRTGPLDDAAVQHIRDAVARIPVTDALSSRLTPATRLNLTMEPLLGVGTIVEVAFPCTIRRTAA